MLIISATHHARFARMAIICIVECMMGCRNKFSMTFFLFKEKRHADYFSNPSGIYGGQVYALQIAVKRG